VPDRDVMEKPIVTCEMQPIEELAHQKAAHQCTCKEIKLIKRDPILASLFSYTTFEEALDDIASQGSETERKQQRDHHGEPFEIGKPKVRVVA